MKRQTCCLGEEKKNKSCHFVAVTKKGTAVSLAGVLLQGSPETQRASSWTQSTRSTNESLVKRVSRLTKRPAWKTQEGFGVPAVVSSCPQPSSYTSTALQLTADIKNTVFSPDSWGWMVARLPPGPLQHTRNFNGSETKTAGTGAVS